MNKSPEIVGYTEAVADIVNKFAKSRITRYAKSHNVTPDAVHVHNDVPINILVKQFKTENGIRCRTYKNLSDDLKAKWLQFYDAHKQLKMLTNAEHELFHKSNTYDVKGNMWIDSSNHMSSVATKSSKSTRVTKTKTSEALSTESQPSTQIKELSQTCLVKQVEPKDTTTVEQPKIVATPPKVHHKPRSKTTSHKTKAVVSRPKK